MTYLVEISSNSSVVYGECPLWDCRRDRLVLTDCFGKKVVLLDPNTGEIDRKSVTLSNEDIVYIGPCMPYASSTEKFLVTLSTGKIVEFDWEKEAVTKVFYASGDSSRCFADGKCDAKGRFWTGSAIPLDHATLKFAENEGQILRFTKSENTLIPHQVIMDEKAGQFDLPNGLAFNKEQTKLGWNDLVKRQVKLFDFQLESGALENPKIVFDFTGNDELDGCGPDGLAKDLKGNLWISCLKGGCILNVDAHTGVLISRIPIPTKNVTSLAFGEKHFGTLFVTTSSIELDGSPIENDKNAGKVFKITNPKDNSFKGFQEHFFD